MVGGGLRCDRSPSGKQRTGQSGARALALVALAFVALGSTNVAAQGLADGEALEECLAPLGEHQVATDLLDAWRTGPAGVESSAYDALNALRFLGENSAGVKLASLVLANLEEMTMESVILSLRGESYRSLGRHDEAIVDYERAYLAASDPKCFHPAYSLYLLHNLRTQAWIDLGLLALADADFQQEGRLSVQVIPADPLSAAEYKVSSGYRSISLALALRAHRRALLTANDLWDDVAEVLPQFVPGMKLRRGHAMVLLARDVRAGRLEGDADDLLETAVELLHSALAGHESIPTDKAEPASDGDKTAGESETENPIVHELAPEERIEGHLSLADAAWLLDDSNLERQQLSILRGLRGESPASFLSEKLARLAAFEARRLLSEEADSASLRVALTELETAYERVEAEWLRVQRPPEGIGFLHFDEQCQVIEMWIRLLLRLEGPKVGARMGLDILARAQSIGTLTQRLGGSPANAGELVAAYLGSLEDDYGVLAFLPSFDQSLILVADRKQVSVHNIGARAELEGPIRALESLVRRRPRKLRAQKVEQAAKRVAEDLLPDDVVKRMKPWRRVLIVGTDLLGSFPMEPLPLGESTLGEQLATSYLPSLSMAELLRQRVPKQAWPAKDLAMLATHGIEKGRPLELTSEELERLEELGGASSLRTGAAAKLGSTGWGANDVLAILGHGHYEPLVRRPAQIILADGLCDGADLEQAQLPLLTCLLTCGAARGPIVRGDAGTVHLGGASLLGGAAAVLLAENDIELEATLALFEGWMERLRSGAPPDVALQGARNALGENEPLWNDPFYSVSLRLLGQGKTRALETK